MALQLSAVAGQWQCNHVAPSAGPGRRPNKGSESSTRTDTNISVCKPSARHDPQYYLKYQYVIHAD
eukprot:scaffold131473_cov16-Prasinocladus_malaysianus.AAC.1